MLQALYYVVWRYVVAYINRTIPELKHKSNNIV